VGHDISWFAYNIPRGARHPEFHGVTLEINAIVLQNESGLEALDFIPCGFQAATLPLKALVLKAYGQLEIIDTTTPEPGPLEVRIRVRACGICGSDVHGMDGSTGRRIPPLIMGHEAAGEIESVGPRVTDWKAGDRVTFDSTIYCGQCPHCRRGDVNLCDNRKVLGVACAEFRQPGAFAEYVVVPERILHRLPGALEFRKAALAEAVAVAVHAVRRTPLAAEGTAVVIGAGMIGLLVIQVLRALGSVRVVAVDLDSLRLELAARLGAHETLRSGGADVPGAVRRMTGGAGADAVFEVVGIASTVRTAVECARKGGSVTLVGNLQSEVPLPLQSVVTRQLTLIGSCASAGEYPESLELIASGRVDVDAITSAVAPLGDGPSWFSRLHASEKGLMKVVLVP
jgi:L-iditol 2-dehydrogenase